MKSYDELQASKQHNKQQRQLASRSVAKESGSTGIGDRSWLLETEVVGSQFPEPEADKILVKSARIATGCKVRWARSTNKPE